jgi:hypothetical protein
MKPLSHKGVVFRPLLNILFLQASTDSRQLVAGEDIKQARRAERGSQGYARLAAAGDSADTACIGSQRMAPHRREYPIGVRFIDDSDESALAGHV